MTNLLKADLYRTSKSKSLYVTAIVCIVFVLLSALLYKGIDIVANTLLPGESIMQETPVGGGDIAEMGDMLVGSFGSSTAFTTAQEILKSDTLIYCLIAIFILVSAVEANKTRWSERFPTLLWYVYEYDLLAQAPDKWFTDPSA